MKIKKILKTAASLLISAALLTGTIPAVSASAADYYIKATTSQTNVRKGPGTEYKAIGKIKGTGKLTYVDAKFDKNYILWYKVKFKNGKTGWISSDYTRRYIKKSALPDVEDELLASDGSAYGDIYEQISDSANEAKAVTAKKDPINPYLMTNKNKISTTRVIEPAIGEIDINTPIVEATPFPPLNL